jgi:hypothetical protein
MTLDLPLEICRLVGYYAAESLPEFKTLVDAGVVDSHPLALCYLQHDFFNMVGAQAFIEPALFTGVRRLKLMHTSNEGLASLVQLAPRVEELDLGRCVHLDLAYTKLITEFSWLRLLRMMDCTTLDQVGGVRHLNLIRCSPVGGDLRSLRTLKLHHCIMAEDVQLSPKLRSFHVNGYFNAFKRGWSLHHMPSLQELNLTMCLNITDDQVSGISGMKNLHTLTLLECELLSNFAFLTNLSKLRVLTVSKNFDWRMLAHLKLDCFTAIRCDVSNLHWLASQPALRIVRLHGYSNQDPAVVLGDLLPKWPHLHTLDLSHWSHFLSTYGLAIFPSVKHLTVDHCTWINNHELHILACSFPSLESLSAKRTRIGDDGLGILQFWKLGLELRELSLSGCFVTDRGLLHLQSFPHLTRLDLSECNIARVDKLPPSIAELDVTRCHKLEMDSVWTLKARHVKIIC